MKIHTFHPFLILQGLFFLLTFFPSTGDVRAANTEEIRQVDQQVSQQKNKIERVQTGIASHQTKVVASREKEAGLLAELDEIEQQVRKESEKLLSLRAEMARQHELNLASRQKLETLAQEKDILRRHMEKRLNAYYRMGNISIMNALFSSSSLADLVSFKENFLLMLQYDRLVITDFKNKGNELERAQKVHEEEKARLAGAADEVMRQQEILNQTLQERQKLLERVTTEKQLYQQALKELEDTAKQLTATLTELEEKANDAREERERQLFRDYPLKPFKKRKPATARGFASQKGKLPLPVAGLISGESGTGTNATHDLTIFANGINIESAPGSDIIAVYDGKVVYTGTLHSYGNLIIVDHGNHYYSLVSGVGETLKKVGELVKQYEKIGVTSLHTGILQEGLHFEIRYNTETQNPLEWMDPSQISFKK